MKTNPLTEFQTSPSYTLHEKPSLTQPTRAQSRRCLARETSNLEINAQLVAAGEINDHRFFPDCEREGWARFIQWLITRKGTSAWFATHTFLNEETPQAADRMYRVCMGRLTQALLDSGGSQLRWIRATEWQRREVIHYHSVVQGIGLDRLSRKSWEDRWETLKWRTPTLNERRSADRSGNRPPERIRTGFCRIYDADLKAAPYLAKYTSKRQGGQIQWGGYWQGLKAPASLACRHSREPAISDASLATPTAR